MTDPARDVWSWTYDLFGDKSAATDPAQHNGVRLRQRATAGSRDRRCPRHDHRVRLDALNRPTSVSHYQASPAGWDVDSVRRYDTFAKGQLTSSTRYVGSTPGVERRRVHERGDRLRRHVPAARGDITLPSARGALAGTYTTPPRWPTTRTAARITERSGRGNLLPETIQYGYTAIGTFSDAGSTAAATA